MQAPRPASEVAGAARRRPRTKPARRRSGPVRGPLSLDSPAFRRRRPASNGLEQASLSRTVDVHGALGTSGGIVAFRSLMIVPAPNVAKHPEHHSVGRRGERSRPSSSSNGRRDRHQTESSPFHSRRPWRPYPPPRYPAFQSADEARLAHSRRATFCAFRPARSLAIPVRHAHGLTIPDATVASNQKNSRFPGPRAPHCLVR